MSLTPEKDRLRARRVIRRVFRMLDHRAVAMAATDEEAGDDPRLRFSVEDVLERVNRAVAQVVPLTKAQHLPLLIESRTHAGGGSNAPGGVLDGVVRLLHSRVFRLLTPELPSATQPVRCRRRTSEAAAALERSGRAGSATFPAYTYDNGHLRSYPAGTVSAVVVGSPSFVTPDDLKNETDWLPLDSRFEGIVVHLVFADLRQTAMKQGSQAATRFGLEDLRPLSLSHRTTDADDREVDVS